MVLAKKIFGITYQILPSAFYHIIGILVSFISEILIWLSPMDSLNAPVLLLVGLVLLAVGGNYVVPVTISLGRALSISPIVISIIVIAGGTSAPELLVSLQAALAGSTEIAIGNVIGSNMANMILVIGLSVLFASFHLDAPMASRNAVIMLGFSLFTGLCLLLFDGIRWMSAFILLATSCLYIWHLISRASTTEEIADDKPSASIILSVTMLLAAISLLIIGADLVVEGGVMLASQAGLSEAVIGLSIIAIGTSLPEIVAVIASVMQRRCDVAIGNIIGSNIFNLGIILGLTGIITPLPRGTDFSSATIICFMLVSCVLTALILRKTTLKRPIAIVFIGFYFGFLNLQF